MSWSTYHEELIAWYDYTLKGVDNGYAELPPVRYWINGANTWSSAQDWPIPGTVKRRFYLVSRTGDALDEQALLLEEPQVETELSYLAIPRHWLI